MNTQPNQKNNALIPLGLVMLIDNMGFSILTPILVDIFMSSSNIVGINASQLQKNLWYGITLSLFPGTMFFSSAFLGSLSDHIGRKKVLKFCLWIAFVSYLVSGIAITLLSLPLLMISRVFSGIAAGSVPVALAIISDISTEETKTKNIGIISFVGMAGFVLGPVVGGIFSNKNISSWFSYSTPLYLAALLALLNLGIFKFLKETSTIFVSKKNFKIYSDQFIVPFRTEKIRFLASIFLFIQLGWSFYCQFIAIFLFKKYQYNSQEVSFFMSWMGLGSALGYSVILKILTKKIQDIPAMMGILFIMTFSILLTVLDIHSHLAWVATFVLGASMACSYAIMLKLLSSAVSAEKQGWIMGISESLCAIAWTLTPLLSGLLDNILLSIPLTLAWIFLFVSALLIQYMPHNNSI